MHILHLGKYYPPEIGGMEFVLQSFAEATRGRLRNYCLVAAKRGRTRVEADGDVTVHYIRESGTFLLSPVLPALPAVLHGLRRRRSFDAIVLHYPNPMAVMALFFSLLLRPKRERLIVWHHADVLLEKAWMKALYALLRPIEEFLFRRTDTFVAATPNHTTSSNTFRRFADRTAIVPFAVPDRWFEVSAEERREAEEIRDRTGSRYILFVGRLVPYKGLGTLVDAATSIDSRIVIVGTGPEEARIKAEIESKGLKGKVILQGRVEDLRPWYLGCEFLVLPSISGLEGFGIVQIEAMALGKPVVTSDLPTGVTYVNRDGETGLVFPVGDAAAFAAACNRLLRDTELRERLGRSALARTRGEFSFAAMASRALSMLGLPGRSEP